MEASRAEFESSDAREGLAPSALFDRPLLKYVGFALLLAWHYVLWFVPNFFFHTQLLDKSVTLSWVASLLLTAVFLFILAGLLGRKRHLSDHPIVLPAAMIAAAALLPLASGALLAFARKDEKRAFPVLLPRSATSSGFKNMLGVGFVTLLACAACYFLSCIIPWEVLPTGEDSFTFGILGGALFILVIAGIYTLSRNRLNIFKIYPALLIAIMVGFSLFLSSTFAYFPAFIVGIGVQSLFEVLLIMYFGILTTKGYATPALTFAMAGGFVRLGLAAGNSLALWYESMAVPVTQALTPPTCLAFMCLLAVVLVPLVRMEFSIVALTAAPPTRNEVEEICAEAAAEFGLSAREAEILLLIARGHTTNSMAEKLVISPHTVNTHIRHIYDKMQIHKRSELLNYLNMQRSDF